MAKKKEAVVERPAAIDRDALREQVVDFLKPGIDKLTDMSIQYKQVQDKALDDLAKDRKKLDTQRETLIAEQIDCNRLRTSIEAQKSNDANSIRDLRKSLSEETRRYTSLIAGVKKDQDDAEDMKKDAKAQLERATEKNTKLKEKSANIDKKLVSLKEDEGVLEKRATALNERDRLIKLSEERNLKDQQKNNGIEKELAELALDLNLKKKELKIAEKRLKLDQK